MTLLAMLSLFFCGEQVYASSLKIPRFVDGTPRHITTTDLVTLIEVGGVGGTGLSVSPDGNYLAFEAHQADVATNEYRVGWFVASTNRGTAAVNVGDGGDATLFRNNLRDGRTVGAWVAEYAKWSPDSSGIAYRKRVNGETQVWWSTRDGKTTRQLTESAADVEDFHWSRDGSLIYFSTDADRTALREAEASRYRHGYVFGKDKDWSTIDGKALFPPYLLTGGEARIWVLDIEAQLERLATADELVEYGQLKGTEQRFEHLPDARKTTLTRAQDAIAWIQPDDPAKQGRHPPQTLYASLAVDGSDPVRCPALECTGILDYQSPLREALHWRAADGEIVFTRAEGTAYSQRTLYGWYIGEKHVRKILSTDEWLSDCSIVEARAICFRETHSQPRVIVSIELADGSVETLVDPNPEFRNNILGGVELFEWKNAHDLETFGYLVMPTDYVPGRRYPLVIVGYRARRALRGGSGDEYPVHLLSKNGFVVLVYEKPTPYEAFEVYTDVQDIGKAMWAELFDVRMPLLSFKSAIDLLSERGLVDSERVAVTGLSNGVGHVNYALIHSDLFAAAITSSSQFAPGKRILAGFWSDWLIKYRKAIGLGPYPGPDGYHFPHLSLSLNAEHVGTPLLVNVSDHEHSWALEEVVALIESDKPVEMVVYPDEGHIKWQPAHRLSVYERNVDWLNFWLQGIEDSNPGKAPQYERWRKQRERHIANLEAEGKEYTLPLPDRSETIQ